VNDGTARCWGHNFHGELGNGGTTDGYVTVLDGTGTNPLTNVVQIAAGYQQTCAVMSDHTARCWGDDDRGELGASKLASSPLPEPVISDAMYDTLTGVAEVVTGDVHTCARLTDGTAWCWGSDEFSQLGAGTIELSDECAATAYCSPVATPVVLA